MDGFDIFSLEKEINLNDICTSQSTFIKLIPE